MHQALCKPRETCVCSPRLRCPCWFLFLTMEGHDGSSSLWSLKCPGAAGHKPGLLTKPCPSGIPEPLLGSETPFLMVHVTQIGELKLSSVLNPRVLHLLGTFCRRGGDPDVGGAGLGPSLWQVVVQGNVSPAPAPEASPGVTHPVNGIFQCRLLPAAPA